MSSTKIHQQIKRVFEQNRREFIRAEVTALNRAGVSSFSNTSKEVRQQYKISASGLKRSVKFDRASKNRLTYRMIFNDYGISLYKFANKQTAGGVRVMQRVGKPVLYKGTFIATMPSGHKGIFGRTSRAKAKKNKKGKWTQLPIKELHGLSVGRLFSATGFVNVMGQHFYSKFPIEFERAMKYGR